MQNENAQHEHYNDEIDLADLVRSLWDGKWLVIGVTLLTMLLALAYLTLVPKSYTGGFDILPLTAAEIEEYQEFNASEYMPVGQRQLLNLFVEELRTYDGLEASILANAYILKFDDESNEEFAARIRHTAYDFTFLAPTAADTKNHQPNWRIIFSTHDEVLLNKVLDAALTSAHDNVNNLLSQRFERIGAVKQRAIEFGLQDVAIAENNALEQYELDKAARLAFLIEQAIIARALDIAQNSLTSQTFATSSSVLATVQSKDAFYLRGYVAIEKEIESLNLRESPIPFIAEWKILNSQKQMLLQDKTIERAKLTFSHTPIGKQKFKAARYDLASIEFQSKTKSSLVLALSVVLGGMLGIFVLLIRNAVVRKD